MKYRQYDWPIGFLCQPDGWSPRRSKADAVRAQSFRPLKGDLGLIEASHFKSIFLSRIREGSQRRAVALTDESNTRWSGGDRHGVESRTSPSPGHLPTRVKDCKPSRLTY
ncbi:hypothetical protein GDO81_017612 [Engystomops pustulosus]|uniref:Uncharacterized protein n=1 Tax=Engystomops pustulosus TaxID=76066 RepID=A0AAV7A936_ENGPU|nr:hypothetical protein GDO81_017612 [Engystomops pustulosus]